MANHDLHEHRILSRLESRERVTQRALSRELGIALGLTNLLMRRLASKGWIQIRRARRQGLQYFVTPAGILAKARLTRAYVRQSVRFYRETRDQMQRALFGLAHELENSAEGAAVVFYGAGEAAEIAFVCLQDTRLDLIAIVDPTSTGPFFRIAMCRPEDLSGDTIRGRRFSRLIVMPLEDEDEVKAVLETRQVSPDNVFWL